MTDDTVRRRDFLQAVGATVLATGPAAASSTNGTYFSVSASHSPTVVEEGDTSVVTGTITNTGDESGVQIVELEVRRGGELIESRSSTVSLDPGESATKQRTATYEDYPGPGSYVGEACSADECARVSWTVAEEDEPAYFDVKLKTVTNPTAGDPVEGEVEVTNTGDEKATQQVTFTVDGIGSDEQQVTLNGGLKKTVSFSIPTETVDAGDYAVTVSSEDDSDSGSVTVKEPPAVFEVELTSFTNPTAGDPVEAEVTVTNTGEQNGTQPITFTVDGLGSAEQEVSLEGGAETTLSFTIPTEPGDAGDYEATVSSENNSDSGMVTITQPAFFAVEVVNAGTPAAGDPVEAEITVTNTGDEAGTQQLSFSIEGLGSAEQEVSLEGDAETTLSFTIPTEQGDDGDYEAIVSSDDDSDSVTLTVEPQPAFFAVELTTLTNPIAGDPVEAEVRVTNTGDLTDTQQLSFRINWLGSDERQVTLEGQSEMTVAFSIPTERDDGGEYNYEVQVSSEDDSDTDTVTVDPQPAFFDVSIVEVGAPTAGEPVEVETAVENTGAERGTQTIELGIDGLGSDSKTVSLDGNADTTVPLSVPTEQGDAGEYTLTVSGENDSDTGTVTVDPQPAFFDVEIAELAEPMPGSPVETAVDVTNTGDEQAEQAISLDVDDLGSDSEMVSLDGSEETTLSMTVPTESDTAGEYTVTVTSDDDSDSRTVSITTDTGTDTAATTETGTDTAATDSNSSDEDGAGFSIPGAVAGMGGTVAYVIKRRFAGGRDAQSD